MATARVPVFFSAGSITINNSLVPAPQGYLLAGSGSVEFLNTSGQTITVAITPSNIFNSSGFTLANNGSQTLTAAVANGSVTYTINGNTAQPYAIQVGGGPMVVSVTGGANPTYAPAWAAVITNGTVQMNGDQKYGVTWDTDPFNPVITQIYQGLSNNALHTGPPTAGSTYTFNCAPQVREVHISAVVMAGGGKIIIRGT